MGDFNAGLTSNIYILAFIAFIACVLLNNIIKSLFRKQKKETVASQTVGTINDAPVEATAPSPTVTEPRTNSKNKKRNQWKGKTEFTHPWLVKNLKGHPGTVLLVDFSPNGKYMAATCDVADARMPVTTHKHRHHPARPPTPTPPAPAPIPVEELTEELQRYILSYHTMWAFGYPLEMSSHPTKAIMYVNTLQKPKPLAPTTWDVNAPEFVPASQSDSGRSSWESTPRSDSDEEADTVKHTCVRCDKVFKMTRDGEYVKEEACYYHWGRIQTHGTYECCEKYVGVHGCTASRFHVWNGTQRGMNGPLDGYVRARLPRGGVYAIDAEMCYTTAGLELARIAVVAVDGRIVYKEYVKPTAPVVDYNTRFSGIRPRDLQSAQKTLRDVQNDILGFVGTDTILIGHALENDLRALKLIHSAVVDTSAIYPHERGYPLRRSLRTLTMELLGRKVKNRKCGGHSPVEDARAALDLVLLKVHADRSIQGTLPPFRPWSNQPVLQPYDPLVGSG